MPSNATSTSGSTVRPPLRHSRPVRAPYMSSMIRSHRPAGFASTFLRDILRAPDFQCDYIQVERASCSLSRAGFQHSVGIAHVGQDCQTAEIGDDLAQDFDPLARKIGRLNREAYDVAARSRPARAHRLISWDCGGGDFEEWKGEVNSLSGRCARRRQVRR